MGRARSRRACGATRHLCDASCPRICPLLASGLTLLLRSLLCSWCCSVLRIAAPCCQTNLAVRFEESNLGPLAPWRGPYHWTSLTSFRDCDCDCSYIIQRQQAMRWHNFCAVTLTRFLRRTSYTCGLSHHTQHSLNFLVPGRRKRQPIAPLDRNSDRRHQVDFDLLRRPG